MAVKFVLKDSDAGRSRSVAPDFTGWKVYKKSDNEEDIVTLEKDAAGTGWFPETPMTARGHLFRGDYHIYFRDGEPLIALSTEDGRLEYAPKSAHVGCFCTPEEEDIAFRYIQEGHGIAGAEHYIADIQDLRTLRRDDCTWRDIIRIPCQPRCGISDFDWPNWGGEINAKMRRIMSESREERFAEGYYTPREIDETGVSTDEVVGLLNGKLTNDSFTFRFGWPKLEFVKGDVFVLKGVHVNLPQCRSVGGDVSVGYNAVLELPLCRSVGRYVNVYENATLDLPQCGSKPDGIYVYENAKYANIGGAVYGYETRNVVSKKENRRVPKKVGRGI